jgi:hypothetical protein
MIGSCGSVCRSQYYFTAFEVPGARRSKPLIQYTVSKTLISGRALGVPGVKDVVYFCSNEYNT